MPLRTIPPDPRFPVRWDCPKPDCYYGVSFADEATRDYWIANHICSKPKRNWVMEETDEKGMPYTKPTHGKTLGEKLWDEVDKCMSELKSGHAVDSQYTSHRASTLCEVIQMHLPHFWVNIDMVRAEALKRWKISQGKMDWEPTPGYQFNPPPHDSEAYKRLLAGDQQEHGAARKASSATKRTTAPAAPKLTDEITKAIVNGLKLGFEPELLASTYNLPVSVVISLRE